MSKSELITVEEVQIATQPQEDTLELAVEKLKMINKAKEEYLINGVDYGAVPNVKRPALKKPGAEKLAQLFQLRPVFSTNKKYLDGGHLDITTKCELVSTKTGIICGEASGSCSTMESKYRYRNQSKKCPLCDSEAIRTDKSTGDFYCWGKIGGCGQQFPSDEPGLQSQKAGKVENENVADQWNTVLKMAEKRALVAAILVGTATSGFFTQDLDEGEHGGESTPQQRQQPRAQNNNLQAPPKITKKVNVPQQQPQQQPAANGDAVVMERLNESFRDLNEGLMNSGKTGTSQAVIKSFFDSLNAKEFSECDKILAGMKLSLDSTMEVK